MEVLGYIFVEEAGEALVEGQCGWSGEFYGEFGIGGCAEGLFELGAARDEELWCMERGEWLGEWKTVVKEETDGEDGGARVVEGCVEEVGAWVVENNGGDGCLGCGKMRRQRGAGADSIGDDSCWR